MKKSLLTLIVIILIGFLSYKLFNINFSESSPKIHSSDLFKKTIVKSQFFEINADKDTTIIGNKGTKIVIPKNSFLDSKGNLINKNISFELSEALNLNDMILSNLTTSSNGKLLETDGMIFINATYKGKNLTINKEIPLYIEIPTKKRKSNMKVYEGVRDNEGNMNWVNPKKIEQYLIPIDLDLLDFLPNDFEPEAINYLNYYKLNSAKKNIDSLYYNLPTKNKSAYKHILNVGGGITVEHYCGINPSIIETIKTNEFNNTFISTKEFEERLKVIFKTCENYILDLYINNLNENLWEVDSLVIERLKEYNDYHMPFIEIESNQWLNPNSLTTTIIDSIGYIDLPFLDKFIEFKNQKLTNVEHKNIYIDELKTFYNKRLLENQKRSDSLGKIAIKKENESEIRIKYAKIKKEREKYTMESYGFTQSQTGWVNIDRGTIPKEWNYQQIEVLVENEISYDQIHTYVIYKDIKSIVKLKSFDNKTFTIDEEFGNSLPVRKNSNIQIVSIAYLGDKTFFATKTATTSLENNTINSLTINLEKTDTSSLNNFLLSLDSYDENTNIKVDLELSKVIKNENQLKTNLLEKAFPCCSNYYFDDIIEF